MTAGSPAISRRSKLLILTAVMASLLEIIDTSIVNVAVPTMMVNLGSTLDEISWVITGYIIANAIVLPIASWMSQQIGRKVYYTGCILLFTAASIACGLAPNLPVLVLFRVLQGFAGGALLPTSQALIYEAFPKEQAGMASAIYGMSVMIGPTIGPTLGGYLTDNFGWRSIFNINVPIGLAVAVLSWVLVEDVGFVPVAKGTPAAAAPPRVRTPVDGVGLALLISGIGCLQFVLERGHAEDWFDSKAITACLIVGVASIIGLIWWELRVKHPILNLRHFANVSFRSGVLLMSGLGAVLYGLLFLVPVFVSSVLGYTATQTGMLFIPGALMAALFMPFIGAQLRVRDPRTLIMIGIFCLGGAVFMISGFNSLTSSGGMFWALLIRGIGLSFLFVPINATVLSQFAGAEIGEAAGILNLCRQLGGSVSIALLSTFFQQYQAESYQLLSGHVTWFDHAGATAFHQIGNAMHTKMATVTGMSDDALSTLSSTKLLMYRVKIQAFVLAYQKTLFNAAAAFFLTLIPLYFLKKPKLTAGPLPDAH